MQRAFNQTQTRLQEMSTLLEENNVKHSQSLEKEKEKTEELRAQVCCDWEIKASFNERLIAKNF